MQHNPFELHAHMAHVKCVFVVPSFGGGATLACNDWRMRREGGGSSTRQNCFCRTLMFDMF